MEHEKWNREKRELGWKNREIEAKKGKISTENREFYVRKLGMTILHDEQEDREGWRADRDVSRWQNRLFLKIYSGTVPLVFGRSRGGRTVWVVWPRISREDVRLVVARVLDVNLVMTARATDL